MFYYIKDSYASQIEGSGFNLRIRYTCMGWSPFWNLTRRAPWVQLPLWYKALFPVSIEILAPEAGEQRVYFRLVLGPLQLFWNGKQQLDYRKENYEQAGLHMAWRGIVKNNWKCFF